MLALEGRIKTVASEVILESYKITIEALAEKHGVSSRRVWMILADMSNQELAELDWKDLDAVVQEGLIREGRGTPEEEPVRQIATPGWEQKKGTSIMRDESFLT